MSLRKLSIIIAFASALLFSLLLLIPALRIGDDKVYDLFLRLNSGINKGLSSIMPGIVPPRKHIDNVVFLDIDDAAIAKVGVFPWPRSVIAEALLRLKEHDAQLAIFDIEYIDKSPTKVDEAYLAEGLANDYNRHFNEISRTVVQVLNAVGSGRVPPEMAAAYINDVVDVISSEKDALLEKTMSITSDDDTLLSQAAALFGKTWGTLNLQEEPLDGEQAERRYLAERLFSYPVNNAGGITKTDIVDILPALPQFSRAVKGSGFTNISPDTDGVRRRIFLTQEVKGYWYLQLAFSPLMNSWGRPDITIQPRRFIIDRQGEKTIIPLDETGAMLLNWPAEDYYDSFKHISLVEFSILEEYERNISSYISLLEYSNDAIFPLITENAAALQEYIVLQREAKQRALENCSDDDFKEYLYLRNQCFVEILEFINYNLLEKYIETESERIIDLYAKDDPELADEILEETKYCNSLMEYLFIEVDAFIKLNKSLNDRLNDKICIFGRTDTGTTDIAVNPFHPKYINVGTHAVVLDTILTKSFITPLPLYYHILFTLLFVPLVLIGLCGFTPMLRSILGFVGVGIAFLLPLLLFIIFSIYLAPLSAVIAMAAAVIVREVFAFVTSEREKKFIRQAFSTYLSPGVVAELIADPSKLNLGGEKREMTVIFTDIASFSTISENLDPTYLVRMLNRYLTVMSNIIMENQGTIDKYEGDAIIAFFGAPIHRPDHAALACRSALAMKKAEIELNTQLLKDGLSPSPLISRIGINTGEMVVGNMGADSKMDYTVMGNSVNLAARLEGVNKHYLTNILLSEYTQKQAGDEFIYRPLDRVRVVGIHTPVSLYELTGIKDHVDQKEISMISMWNNAITCYREKRFAEAVDLFSNFLQEKPNDKVTDLFLQRCIKYMTNPPDQRWDGVINLTEK